MRKLAILGLCAVLMLAVFACSASAAVSVTSAFSETQPTFGGASQKASNPQLDEDDSDYNIYAIGTVAVFNNATTNVTIDSITPTYKMGFTASDLNITLKQSVVVPANSSANVEIRARVPEGLDAVNTVQKAVAFNVADIVLNSGANTVASFSSYMQRKNYLEISDIKVLVGDKSQSVDKDGDEVNEIKPGDTVELIVKAENNYRDADDTDIEADSGSWEIGGDVDEEEDLDFGSLAPKDEEELSFRFTLDDDVDEGREDLLVFVYGEDDNGAMHGQRITADFRIEKQSHEIAIQDIAATPSSVTCGGSLAVKVDIANIGKKDEDEVSIRVRNDDMDIDSLKTNIVLDEGDSTSKTFDIVIPFDAKAGSKAFTVTTYYNFNTESTRDVFTVDVKCQPSAATGSAAANTTTTTSAAATNATTAAATATSGTATAEPTAASASNANAPVPITTTHTSQGQFRDSTTYVLLLILAIVILVVAGAVLIAKMIIAR